MNFKLIAKSAKDFVVKNLPTILTITGIAGSVSSTVLAIKLSPKAIEAINEMKAKKSDPNALDYIKVAAPIYWPVAATEAAAIGCIIGANSVNLKRQASLMAAYVMSEKNLDSYKKAVKETFGEKKAKETDHTAIKDMMSKGCIDENNIISTGDGNMLYYEPVTGKYFRSSIAALQQDVSACQRELKENDILLYNDFLRAIGVPTVGIGDIFGWSYKAGDEIAIDFEYGGLAPNGEQCIGIIFSDSPKDITYEEL